MGYANEREVVRSAIVFVASAGHADDHPVFYVDKGACPFECCTYRDWGTEKTTKLYAEPRTSSPVVGAAEKGATVKAQTGEVHTKPGKFIASRDYIRHTDRVTLFKEGDVLWVYTNLGEGYYKIWYRGRFFEFPIPFIENEMDSDYYKRHPDELWGYFEVKPVSVWWVKVRTRAGLEGWSNQPEHFSNQDACG